MRVEIKQLNPESEYLTCYVAHFYGDKGLTPVALVLYERYIRTGEWMVKTTGRACIYNNAKQVREFGLAFEKAAEIAASWHDLNRLGRTSLFLPNGETMVLDRCPKTGEWIERKGEVT